MANNNNNNNDLENLLKDNNLTSRPVGEVEVHKVYDNYTTIISRLQDGDVIHVISHEDDMTWEITCGNTGNTHKFRFPSSNEEEEIRLNRVKFLEQWLFKHSWDYQNPAYDYYKNEPKREEYQHELRRLKAMIEP